MRSVPPDDLTEQLEAVTRQFRAVGDQLRGMGQHLEHVLASLRPTFREITRFMSSHEYQEMTRVLNELEHRDGNLPEIILDATPAELIDLLRRLGIIRPPRRRGRPRMEDDGGGVWREIAREARALKARKPFLSWETIARTRFGISGRHLRNILSRFPEE
ncbi:hypothetical protein [Sphaerobacter thermophilus]|uniref:Uncharacterized protein n=1 Tax=Sphaerobacter thermophilus (strain ATCC 49802 / DSM 20745 / KCCM 41009 / NCIMB 13125 / S 6022) TaxID=479434 RepID=D1C6Q5_SPHTD|nr:hypothetical protein [Sphaerobacter thermophilus]ACZ39680.1 hypothetical protein Sthe_2259 [Sphaerobacter thermophilus DSM 20745]